jgi:predicted phosphodiesterase
MPTIRNIVLGGKRVLLSHGHLWRVKGGYDTAIAEGEKAGADLLLFGHTHTPLCRQTESGMWVLNPGSARSTYGLVTIEADRMDCQILKMP